MKDIPPWVCDWLALYLPCPSPVALHLVDSSCSCSPLARVVMGALCGWCVVRSMGGIHRIPLQTFGRPMRALFLERQLVEVGWVDTPVDALPTGVVITKSLALHAPHFLTMGCFHVWRVVGLHR